MSLCGEADFAAVWSFLTVAGEACALDANAFTIPDLAEHLEDAQEAPEPLKELYCKLLRRAVRSFRPNNWERYLIKFCHDRGNRRDGWELERFGYRKASARVKLRVLKNLLEHQFVCNPKFKAAINKMENRTLRLNPIGRDAKGRCYWLQKDHRANVRLYREDQDEETWKLIASDRTSLFEVIAALKSGKSPVDPSSDPALNEDSNSLGSPYASGQTNGDENSGKNHGSPAPFEKSDAEDNAATDRSETGTDENSTRPKNAAEDPPSGSDGSSANLDGSKLCKNDGDVPKRVEENSNCKADDSSERLEVSLKRDKLSKRELRKRGDPAAKRNKKSGEDSSDGVADRVGEEIEEKVMIVKGDGDGADCESLPSHYFSEEIEEEVMYFYGEGSGSECTMGNPALQTSVETVEQSKDAVDDTEKQCILSNDKIENKAENASVDDDLTICKDKVESQEPSVGEDKDSGEQSSSELNSSKEDAEGKTAPLPFSKRFLQNIPKTSLTECSDSNASAVKNKLWSVDSLCGNSQSDESPEKNVDFSNETVLLKNSTIDGDKDNFIISSSSGKKSEICKAEVVGSVNSIDSVSDNTIEKAHIELNIDENITLVNCDSDNLKNENISDKLSDSSDVQNEFTEKNELNSQNTSIVKDSVIGVENSSNGVLNLPSSIIHNSAESSISELNTVDINMQNTSSLGASTLNLENDKMPLDGSLIEKSVLNSEKSQDTNISLKKEINLDCSTVFGETENKIDDLHGKESIKSPLIESNENTNTTEELNSSIVENQDLVDIDETKNLPLNDGDNLSFSPKNEKLSCPENDESHISKSESKSLYVENEANEPLLNTAKTLSVVNEESENVDNEANTSITTDVSPKETVDISLSGDCPTSLKETNDLSIDKKDLDKTENTEISMNLELNPSVSITTMVENSKKETNEEAKDQDILLSTTLTEKNPQSDNSNVLKDENLLSRENLIETSSQKQDMQENKHVDSCINITEGTFKTEETTFSNPSSNVEEVKEKLTEEFNCSLNLSTTIKQDEKAAKPDEETTCDVDEKKYISKVENETNCIVDLPSVMEEKEFKENAGCSVDSPSITIVEGATEVENNSNLELNVEEIRGVSKIEGSEDCSSKLLSDVIFKETSETKGSSNSSSTEEKPNVEEITSHSVDPISTVDEAKECSNLEENTNSSTKSPLIAEEVKIDEDKNCTNSSPIIEVKDSSSNSKFHGKHKVDFDAESIDVTFNELKSSANKKLKLESSGPLHFNDNTNIVEKEMKISFEIESHETTSDHSIDNSKVESKELPAIIDSTESDIACAPTEDDAIQCEKSINSSKVDDSGILAKRVKIEYNDASGTDKLNNDVDSSSISIINEKEPKDVKVEKIENSTLINSDIAKEPIETSDTTSKIKCTITESTTNQPSEPSTQEPKKSKKSIEAEENTVPLGVRTRRSESLKDTKVPNSTNVEENKVETVSPKTKRSRLLKNENVEENKVKENRKRGRDESESTSDLDEPSVAQNKKFKPKQKIINPKLRKKIEEKKTTQDLSSEDEIDASSPKAKKLVDNPIPDKKTPVKRGRKEKVNKSKVKDEDEKIVEQVEEPPVRQSRRIALLKIKEEAQRRLMEEMALRELKAQHKKKNSKNKDQDWQKSSSEHSSDEAFAAKKAGRKSKKHEDLWKKKGIGWHSSSGGNETDTEPGEEPEDDFDEQADEDILISKSDHEFSPESDVDCDEWTPVRRARTLKKEDGEEEEIGAGCVKCGKTDHPEWILLCDSCDAGWHASCLKPVLFLIPEGEWFCPPCNHKTLIESLEVALKDHDKQVDMVKNEDIRRKKAISNQFLNKIEDSESDDASDDMTEESEKISSETCSSNSSSDDEKIYRLRERRQLPISYRFKEYDQLISSAIKEEYKEVDNSGAGNQGRGKDISTIIEADKEEKKAMMQAEQDKEAEGETKVKRRNVPKPRRKPRKLNSLEVVSDDCDDNSDEDFKETGWSTSSSEEIISDHTESKSSSSDSSAPLKRTTRTSRAKTKRNNVGSKDRKKRNRRIVDSTSESNSDMEVHKKKKQKSSKEKSGDSTQKNKKRRKEKKDENPENADGTKGKAKIRYGGLSDSSKSSHDWSPAHRTRQRKYNYMELPNTESEDEAHKPSGKHMDSSDEYKGESDSSDSDSSRGKEKAKSLAEDGVTNSKEAYQKQLQSHDQAVTPVTVKVNKARRGGKIPNTRTGSIDIKNVTDETMPSDSNAKTSLLEIGKVEGQVATVAPAKTSLTPLQAERERKRMEKQMEKDKRKEERLKKKEEKQQIKDQKAKEREEKKLAKLNSAEQNFGGLQQSFTLTTPIPIRQPVGFPRPIQPIHPNFVSQPQLMSNIRSPMPQFPNPMRQRMEHPNLASHIQQIDKGGLPLENREQTYNYHRPPLLNSQILPPKSDVPENNERPRLIEDRKPMPPSVDFRPFAIDGRKGFPIGSQTAFADPRGISPNFDNHSPGPRPFHPMYAAENNDNPILRENLQGRPVINNSIDNVGNNLLARNGVPIADLTGDRKLITPVRADSNSNSPHLAGQEPSPPKRRGRGPGKKTLARQAAAALTSTPEGSSPSPSNSPLMEGTLTVAGAPQPFRPNVDPPSVITRMPHMMPPPYRGSMYNSGQIFGSPRPLGNHIPMAGAYRPHHPHPHGHSLDPSPSGGGPISMASPERSSPHNPYSPYQSPYYPPASTPPQIGHYPPAHGRYPGPPVQGPPSSSPRPPNTPESGDGEDKAKPPREHTEPSQFIKSEIKQEPINIKQSSSPTEEIEESNSNERRSVEPDEQPSNFSTTNIQPTSRPVHPQIKHTESKSERGGRSRLSLTTAARYPQGPYAPQYGPYAPHPPPVPEVSYLHPHHSNHPPQHLSSVHRPMYSHHPAHIGPVPMPTRPPNILPLAEHLPPEDAPPNALPPHIPPGIPGAHVPHGDETSEFGGLVSYFSSQREDDIDT